MAVESYDLDQLEQALTRAAAVNPQGLSGEEIRSAVQHLHRLVPMMDAVLAKATAALDATKAYRVDGSRSASTWIARHCRTRRDDNRKQLGIGRALKNMPVVAAAFEAGEITTSHVRVLNAARNAVPEQFSDFEAELVDNAQQMEYSDFVATVAYWRQLTEPDDAEELARKQYEQRRGHLSETIDGQWRLDAWFDPVGGAIFNNALDQIYNELFKADWDEAKQRLGRAVTVKDLARTPAQRRADALVEMATRAMATPPGSQRPRPLITVLVDYPTLHGRICELSNGTVITPGELLPLLVDADIERVVFGPQSLPIDVGAHRRLYKGPTRRAVEVRDRYCVHPGCTVPAEGCEVHHIVDFPDGPTTMANGELRCPAHHPRRFNRPQRRPKRGKSNRDDDKDDPADKDR